MGNNEIIAYTNAKTAFVLAKEEIRKLAAIIRAVAQEIPDNWRGLHPDGMPFFSDYPPGQISFNPQKWPDGQRISDVLRRCHDAFRALQGAYRPQQERQTLNLIAPPVP
jgi:hypothetical protein